jgi:hypothetical protein
VGWGSSQRIVGFVNCYYGASGTLLGAVKLPSGSIASIPNVGAATERVLKLFRRYMQTHAPP